MSKYDAPCADCARVLPGTARSLPAGLRRCHRCRGVRRDSRSIWAPQELTCSVCAALFVARHPTAKYCVTCKRSRRVGGPPRPKVQATDRLCRVCGVGFRSTGCRKRCEDCRASRYVACGDCAACGAPYFSTVRSGRFCSPACGTRAGRLACCSDCGMAIQARTSGRYCPTCRKKRERARGRRKNAVRRGAAACGPPMTIEELGERDGWICHLCDRRVGRAFRYPDGRCPTFDHLIPVSAGGTDAAENLRLAHLECNLCRGAGGTVQLLLVG